MTPTFFHSNTTIGKGLEDYYYNFFSAGLMRGLADIYGPHCIPNTVVFVTMKELIEYYTVV